jgi:hypothetical protein
MFSHVFVRYTDTQFVNSRNSHTGSTHSLAKHDIVQPRACTVHWYDTCKLTILTQTRLTHDVLYFVTANRKICIVHANALVIHAYFSLTCIFQITYTSPHSWCSLKRIDFYASGLLILYNVSFLTRTVHLHKLLLTLKGQSHEIFDPRFFSLNGTPGCPDSWAKAVFNIDSNSRRNSILFDYKNRLRAMRHYLESIFFC